MKEILKKMFLVKHSPPRLAYMKLLRSNRNFNPFESVKDFDELIKTANQIRDAVLLDGRRSANVRSLFKDVVNSYE